MNTQPTPTKGMIAFTLSCYILICAIVLLLFSENFVFSSHLGLLGFREIDDIAFQASLRRIHLLLQTENWKQLWMLNDYGYGWIFWAPLALITYPLFLLSTHFSIDWPLIAIPRQVSLLFAVLSLLIMRKSLQRMHAPEWVCAGALLIFSLYPTFGYFSMRFGTVNAVMFFSVLSFYLAQRDDPSSSKGRLLIALSLAIAGGIKLSGLFILPLIAMLVMIRLRNQKPIKILSTIAMPSLIFLGCLILFTNPSLFKASFHPALAVTYWKELSYFIDVTKIRSGPTNPFVRFYSGVFGTTTNAMVMLGLMIGMLFAVIKEKIFRADIIAAIITLFLTTIYLIVAVKNAGSEGYYFTAVSFLFLLGTISFSRSKKSSLILLIFIGLLLEDAFTRTQQDNQWNHLSYYIKAAHAAKDIIIANQVEKCILASNNKNHIGQIFMDFTLHTTINSLSYPSTCISMAWDNLSPAGKYCNTPVDYLILDAKKAIGALPQAEFEARMQAADPKLRAGYLQDRASRINLTKSGKFGGQFFKPLCKEGNIQVYKSIQ
jgi:hypothetical protein